MPQQVPEPVQQRLHRCFPNFKFHFVDVSTLQTPQTDAYTDFDDIARNMRVVYVLKRFEVPHEGLQECPQGFPAVQERIAEFAHGDGRPPITNWTQLTEETRLKLLASSVLALYFGGIIVDDPQAMKYANQVFADAA